MCTPVMGVAALAVVVLVPVGAQLQVLVWRLLTDWRVNQ